MNKSYVFYIEVEPEDNLMDCIYFVNGECWATPFAMKAKMGPMESVGGIEYYKPTEQDQKAFCKNIAEFRACPRFQAYQDHLRAIGLEK